jgi:hypothetical protein
MYFWFKLNNFNYLFFAITVYEGKYVKNIVHLMTSFGNERLLNSTPTEIKEFSMHQNVQV